jgi:hypothetical protein
MQYRFREAATAASCAVMALSAFANSDGTDAVLRGSASLEAQDVYHYIATRPDDSAAPSKRLIVGQHLGGYSDLDTATHTHFTLTHGVQDPYNSQITLYPGMVGARYDAPDGTLTAANIQAINTALINYWRSYHSIIAITATPRNPWNQAADRNWTSGDGPLTDLLTNQNNPGAYANFWNDAQLIADGLEQLKAAGVPVVLRPFAEYNIGKYYGPAGPHTTPTDFTALWGQVWVYYVTTRNLDNLIFCWEAWVLNRNSADLASWFPSDDASHASQVDIVSGAYYFPAPTSTYFPLPSYALTLQNTTDQQVQHNLLVLAETYDKPFGAAQWGLNYNPGNSCDSGGNWNDTLGFYNSVTSSDNVSKKRRTAFIYHWTGNCAVEMQNQNDNGTGGPWGFVSNTAVAMSGDVLQVVGFSAAAGLDGWIEESQANSQKGGGTVGANLRTGDSSDHRGYRSILSFQTSLPMPVLHATLRMRSSGQNVPGMDPYPGLKPLHVDVLDHRAGGVQVTDFQESALTADAASMTDPDADTTLTWAEAPLQSGMAQINLAGPTRLRVWFDKSTDGNPYANYFTWYLDDAPTPDDRPQLVVTYQPTP